jgi:CelD/BcsL family acetyltransferase involved in cellulose biosynthesis
LHALRWEGRPDGSCFATAEGQRFHRDALRRLAAVDAARLTMLRLDGRAIAFHYWFALEGRMYVHRLAFDPALGRFSPGLVNTLDAIEAAAAEGLSRVEFLGGGERYKVELADSFAPLYQGYAATSGIHGRAFCTAQIANIRLRLALKRSERIHRLYFEDLAPARRVARRLNETVRRRGMR